MGVEDKYYSEDESLDRIWRILNGTPLSSDEPFVSFQDEHLSKAESLSNIAELLANGLPGHHLHSPAGGVYGEIYAWTGTNTMESLPNTAYTKITGAFQNETFSRDVTCTPTSDRMTLAKTGYYFVDWSATLIGSSAVTYSIEPYHGALGIPQAVARAKPASSGTVVNLSGHGIFEASGTSQIVDLRVKPDTNSVWMRLDSVELRVYKIGEIEP